MFTIIVIFFTIYPHTLDITHLSTLLYPLIIMAFLFFCPGILFVRFLNVREPAVKYSLALALSLAIDAFLAGIFLYAGWWSPVSIIGILEGLCLIGTIVQFILASGNFANLKKLVPKPLDRTRAE